MAEIALIIRHVSPSAILTLLINSLFLFHQPLSASGKTMSVLMPLAATVPEIAATSSSGAPASTRSPRHTRASQK